MTTRSSEPSDRPETQPMAGEPRGPGTEDSVVVTEKGRRTRARILDAALDLLHERGFEGTTMREVARRAGVSLGSAYYYFQSKEHLVQQFYQRTHDEHLAACQEPLAVETELDARLRLVVRSKIDTSMPHHRFAGVLFKTAADPQSPLSPFSAASAPVRAQATALMREVVDGARQRVPAALAAELPNLLWLYLMGILLFWVHDASPACRRTHRLIDGTVPLVCRLIRVSRLPLVGDWVASVVSVLADLRSSDGEPGPAPVSGAGNG